MADKFFVTPSSNTRKRTFRETSQRKQPERTRRANTSDDDITSESESGGDTNGDAELSVSESESDDETAADKRRRLAKEYLNSLETDLVEGFDAKDLDEDIIARRLKHDAAEEKGHIFRNFEGSVPSDLRKTRLPQSKHLTCIAASGHTVYVGAKDGSITKLRLRESTDGAVKATEVDRVVCESTEIKRPARDAVLAIATNGRFVAVGLRNGFAVYNGESLELLKEFRVHGNVLSLAFRKNTSELYVGASDLRLRTYDLSHWAFVETLHGHQDEIVGLSALTMERCVSVGARDRTAIFWKIPEESRLTFMGGDTKVLAHLEEQHEKKLIDKYAVTLEGSIDCCSMLDHQIFVTGSDNGNVSLWSTGRKKPLEIKATAHGLCDQLTPQQFSGEKDASALKLPPPVPHPITAVAAIPFSNTFFTGSDSGIVSMWCLNEEKRAFSKTKDIEIGQGFVTGISVTELENEFAVCVSLSREPRLGRWQVRNGRDQVVTFAVREQ